MDASPFPGGPDATRIRAYHFTGDCLRDGQPIPEVGAWLQYVGPIRPCYSGLHASEHPFDAFMYARGPRLHLVELEGDLCWHGERNTPDKVVGRRRRIVASIDATQPILAFVRETVASILRTTHSLSLATQVALRTGTLPSKTWTTWTLLLQREQGQQFGTYAYWPTTAAISALRIHTILTGEDPTPFARLPYLVRMLIHEVGCAAGEQAWQRIVQYRSEPNVDVQRMEIEAMVRLSRARFKRAVEDEFRKGGTITGFPPAQPWEIPWNYEAETTSA